MQFFSTIMPLVLVKIGEVPDMATASEKAAVIAKDLEQFFADGEVIDTRFGTVVGQKPA
jgi:hypothetical protein